MTTLGNMIDRITDAVNGYCDGGQASLTDIRRAQDALVSGFDWGKTGQGYDYWRTVVDHLIELEDTVIEERIHEKAL